MTLIFLGVGPEMPPTQYSFFVFNAGLGSLKPGKFFIPLPVGVNSSAPLHTLSNRARLAFRSGLIAGVWQIFAEGGGPQS